jgi:hypothetical protein
MMLGLKCEHAVMQNVQPTPQNVLTYAVKVIVKLTSFYTLNNPSVKIKGVCMLWCALFNCSRIGNTYSIKSNMLDIIHLKLFKKSHIND